MKNNEIQKISIFKGKNGLWGATIKIQIVVPFIYSNKEYVYREIKYHSQALGFKYTTEEI